MKFDLQSLLITIISGSIAGVISYFIGRKKSKAETKKIEAESFFQEIKNLSEITEYWKKYSNDLEIRVNSQSNMIQSQEKKINELQKQINELSKEVKHQCTIFYDKNTK